MVGNEDGVSFTAGGIVMNGVGGLISGLEFGVLISGGVGDTAGFISNAGQVNGNFYAIGLTGEGDAYVDNSGAATGLLAGVFVTSTTGDARIVNSGTIEGSYYGLAVLAATDKTVTIFNSGVIKQSNLITGSESGAIVAAGGAVTLENTGRIVGFIEFGGIGASDLIENDGAIEGQVLLGEGNDTFLAGMVRNRRSLERMARISSQGASSPTASTAAPTTTLSTDLKATTSLPVALERTTSTSALIRTPRRTAISSRTSRRLTATRSCSIWTSIPPSASPAP